MNLDLQTLSIIGVPSVAVIIWLVRLEGRVNLTERMRESTHEDIVGRLDRMERKIDTLQRRAGL